MVFMLWLLMHIHLHLPLVVRLKLCLARAHAPYQTWLLIRGTHLKLCLARAHAPYHTWLLIRGTYLKWCLIAAHDQRGLEVAIHWTTSWPVRIWVLRCLIHGLWSSMLIDWNLVLSIRLHIILALSIILRWHHLPLHIDSLIVRILIVKLAHRRIHWAAALVVVV